MNKEESANLIAEISRKVEGVGPSKAYAISEFLDNDWASFLSADSQKLSKIKKDKGSRILQDSQIKQIVAIKKEFIEIKNVRDAWIYLIGKDFLISQIETLKSVSLSNLDINPFLMKVLDLKTAKEILEFNLYQTVTRSIVTSWGLTVEKLLVHSGAKEFIGDSNGRPGRKPDIEKKIKEKKYYIQIKSGPNTMNVDMVNSLNEVIEQYKENKPNSTFILGMTYGTEDRISAQIRGNLNNFEDSILIGRDLWDFVSEEKNFHKEVFKILDESSSQITSEPFSSQLDKQLNILISEWEKKFKGKNIDEVFETYI